MATLDPKFRRKLGKRVRELRKSAALSQMGVIRASDFSLSHLQKLERGDLDPKVSTLLRLAEVYGVSLSELFDGL